MDGHDETARLAGQAQRFALVAQAEIRKVLGAADLDAVDRDRLNRALLNLDLARSEVNTLLAVSAERRRAAFALAREGAHA